MTYLMLRRPAYMGKKQLSEWRDEPGELVDALHEAIVDESVFYEVQRRRFAAAEDRGAYRMTKIPLGTEELGMIRYEHLPKLAVTLWGKIIDQYLLNEEPTAWGLLNAGTNVTWHNENGSAQDFAHNEAVVTGPLHYAAAFVN